MASVQTLIDEIAEILQEDFSLSTQWTSAQLLKLIKSNLRSLGGATLARDVSSEISFDSTGASAAVPTNYISSYHVRWLGTSIVDIEDYRQADLLTGLTNPTYKSGVSVPLMVSDFYEGSGNHVLRAFPRYGASGATSQLFYKADFDYPGSTVVQLITSDNDRTFDVDIGNWEITNQTGAGATLEHQNGDVGGHDKSAKLTYGTGNSGPFLSGSDLETSVDGKTYVLIFDFYKPAASTVASITLKARWSTEQTVDTITDFNDNTWVTYMSSFLADGDSGDVFLVVNSGVAGDLFYFDNFSMSEEIRINDWFRLPLKFQTLADAYMVDKDTFDPAKAKAFESLRAVLTMVLKSLFKSGRFS